MSESGTAKPVAESASHQPSETSPLLPKTDTNRYETTSAPASVEPTSDGGEVVRTTSGAGGAGQYQGLPEVRKKMYLIFPAMAIGVFLAAADQTLITTSYGVIGTDLQALEKTSWIATAYFLTLTSSQPLYGKLSDIFSRKACLLVGYTIFSIGCLLCGLSRNIYELIAARALAGIGGGGMSSVVSIILSDVIPLQQRGVWQGYINIIYASGASTGSAVGGILADTVGWRLSFLLQVPMCVLAFTAVFFALHLPTNEEAGWSQRLKRIDFAGALVLVLATSCLLVGLDRGSNVAWLDPWCLAPLCSAFPLYMLFLFVELRVASEPFAPGHVIGKRSPLAGFLCYFFSHAGWIAGMFYVSLYYQAVFGKSASQAGLLALPQIFCSVSGSLTGGYYMRRSGKFYWGVVVPYGTLALGMGMLILAAHFRVLWLVVLSAMVCGFSNGFGITTVLIALSSSPARFCMWRS